MIEVEEMVIRVPGMQPEDAKWIGEEVANCITTNLPEHSEDKRIGELNIKLTMPAGSGRIEIADSIAKQILQQLTMI